MEKELARYPELLMEKRSTRTVYIKQKVHIPGQPAPATRKISGSGTSWWNHSFSRRFQLSNFPEAAAFSEYSPRTTPDSPRSTSQRINCNVPQNAHCFFAAPDYARYTCMYILSYVTAPQPDHRPVRENRAETGLVRGRSRRCGASSRCI